MAFIDFLLETWGCFPDKRGCMQAPRFNLFAFILLHRHVWLVYVSLIFPTDVNMVSLVCVYKRFTCSTFKSFHKRIYIVINAQGPTE